jgi:hypothetical protein
MRGKGLPEEVLSGSDAVILAQEEVDGTALLVDCSIQVFHWPLTRM